MFTRAKAVFLSEKNALFMLYWSAAALHLLVFALLFLHYGPYSFFLSVDGSLSNNDTQHYVVIAKNIVEGNGYSRFPDAPFEPDALRTPLLPLYFVPFVYIGGLSFVWFAILILQFVLCLAPLVLYKLSRVFLPHPYALVAGFLLVFEPIFIYRSQIAEPDALLVLFILVATYFAVRFWKSLQESVSGKYFYYACLTLGLSILAKPTALYVTILFFFAQIIFLLWFQKKMSLRDLKTMAIGGAIILALLSPWLIRNHRTFGVWSISSIATYNVYEYYTGPLKLPGEQVPDYIQTGSREPSRYLAFQDYFMKTALSRIKAQPKEYAKDQVGGSFRNVFVSDLPAIYYYGHSKILPFPYNPESKINLHQLLREGNVHDFLRALLFKTSLKIVWALALLLFYLVAIWGVVSAWRKDKIAFFSFMFFGVLFAYFVFVSGPYVDAKYRLPALPLMAVIALYGFHAIRIAHKKVPPRRAAQTRS